MSVPAGVMVSSSSGEDQVDDPNTAESRRAVRTVVATTRRLLARGGLSTVGSVRALSSIGALRWAVAEQEYLGALSSSPRVFAVELLAT